MAKALLIKRDDVMTFSNVNGNIDTDKMIQYIAIAQDMHLQRYLGTDLLEKLQADVVADTLSSNYLTLVQDWVKPALIHWTMVELIPMIAVTIGNGGIYRHSSENATALSSVEVSELVSQERDFATYYSKRLVDYLCNNSELFPEYSSNSNEDVDPSTDTNFCGWVL
jgi:hypothetical protein